MRRQFSPRRANRGFALLALFAFLMAGVLYFVVTSLGPDFFEAYRARKTEAALAEARDALLGYALQYRDKQGNGTQDVYGYLPLPDLGTSRNTNNIDTICHVDGNLANPEIEGCSAINFAGNGTDVTAIGRLPWRTLGIPPLRDGNGECLWLIVSGSHQSTLKSAPPMNWDTLGQLDLAVANGGAALAGLLASRHERPVAIVVSAGPALGSQNRGELGVDDVSECRGNYEVANYFDPEVLGALGGVTNYFGGAAKTAFESTKDDSGTGGADRTKTLSVQGQIHKDPGAGANLWANACPSGSNCELVANDRGLAITPDTVFGALRKSSNFRVDINSMIDRMFSCMRDKIAASSHAYPPGRIEASTCYDDYKVPRGYFTHWGELVFASTYSPPPGCRGVLVFANQRGPGQSRTTAAEKDDIATNYLENGYNLSAHTVFETLASGQSVNQDIVRCIPTVNTASFAVVGSPPLAPTEQLVSYNPGSQTLTLGKAGITTGNDYAAGALFGCAWTPETNNQGNGFRAYFRFRFMGVTGSGRSRDVGSNGFIFAAVDGISDPAMGCGAAGSHLGYSGYNGYTSLIAIPRVGIEFDQARDTDEVTSAPDSGRDDPCGTDCGKEYNSHSAIVYWGDSAVSYDDNVHGAPASQTGIDRPAPQNPDNINAASPGIAFVNYRGTADVDGDGNFDSYAYHVRVEFSTLPMTFLSLPGGSVLAASSVEVDTASPGSAIDGIALASGSRVLLTGQSNSAEDGVYVWQDATTPMARATDSDSATELTNAWVNVAKGTNAGTWRQRLSIVTVGTDPQSWQQQFHFTHFGTQVWIERDSDTTAQIRTAMQDTTRSMSQLYPGYPPRLSDVATMYDIVGGACGSGCPSGQVCGQGNLCYRQAFKSVRLGFTNSQRTQDQQVIINDFFASWLP